jgi:phage repressor protein C with HTH and peptisase S24 domain
MSYDPEQARSALAAFKQSTGLKDAPWEKASGVGSGTIRKFEKGPNQSMGPATYSKLAAGASELLGRRVLVSEFAPRGEDVSVGTLPSPAPVEPVILDPNVVPAPGAPRVPLRQEMPKDVPVYGTIVGGSHTSMADFELNGQIVDYVRRPPRLAGRTDVFAAFCQGDSMLYWREPGQLVYFERAKPPKTNDYVLVELMPPPHDADGVRPALIKRLLGVTPTKIRLRQYNPPKDFEIDRSKVLQVVRALDWDELMGV